jgi:hypothetical protein
MTHRNTAWLPVTTLRLALLGATLALPLAATLVPPAHAQSREDRGHEGRSYEGRGHDDHGRGRAEDRRDRNRDQGRWRDQNSYGGYYHRPDLYYSAPPVVVQHPGYYRQPAPAFNFQVPFFYR